MYQFRRSCPFPHRTSISPEDVACGIFPDLLPIVVICARAQEAMKVDVLNSEVFAHIQDPDDEQEIAEALRASHAVTRTFTHGEKLYAVRYGKETGIYGVAW